MPMELLFTLAQGDLPRTIDSPSDIDKLRVIAAAELVHARLPEVGAREQTAQVLSITWQGRAALAKAYPHHCFNFGAAPRQQENPFADWRPSKDAYELQRDGSRTTLDS